MDKTLSVSEFIREINELLSFPVTVEGEVSSFGISQGKWVFFDLKDEAVESKIGCFMPVWKLKTSIEDGMRVRIFGTPRIHDKSGKFSITVEHVEPVGEGALKRAFELLFKKLEVEGLFSLERKRVVTRFPERIGLIASRESAAYSDFMRILSNRWGGIEIMHAHVQVQGASAVGQIVGALRYFSSPDAAQVDAVVLIRGGGSLEDLQAFNSEDVARAIYGSRVPVIVGVGHEPDVSIADYVADVRASTPSNAAERLVPDRAALEHRVRYAVGVIDMRLEGILEAHRRRIDAVLAVIDQKVSRQVARFEALSDRFFASFRQFERRLVEYGGRVTQAVARLSRAQTHGMGGIKTRLDFLSRTVSNLNPERLLSRGYSIVRAHGKILTDAKKIVRGTRIEVRLHHGTLEADTISSQHH